jgi:hypothetical protein
MAKKVNKVNEAAKAAGIGEKQPSENIKINRPKGRVLSSAAGFFHFDETTPVFVGTPLGTLVHDPDPEKMVDGKPKLVGFDFVDDNGEPTVIGATNAIQKALSMETKNSKGETVPVYLSEQRVSIRWAGKIDLKNGQSFNKFEIILLE